MKRQINRLNTAHLFRAALYVFLLVVGCSIPYALAQRVTAVRNVPARSVSGSQLPNSSSPTGSCNVLGNGGFETGAFTPWVIDGVNNPPVVTNTKSYSGTFSAFAGSFPATCGTGVEANGDSSFYQQFTVPAGGGTLSFWHWDCSTDTITFDWQDAYITDTNGNILQTIFQPMSQWADLDQPDSGHDIVCRANRAHQIPSTWGRVGRPHRNVCRRG